jgi:hypothetical protein
MAYLVSVTVRAERDLADLYGEINAEHSDAALRCVWSKISNALKRLDFWSHNFLAQLLSETSRACTIRGSTIKFREALE